MIRSFQVIEPGVLTSDAPMWVFGSHRHSAAPTGSMITAIRPTSITSNASAAIVAPSSPARVAEPSADSTVT